MSSAAQSLMRSNTSSDRPGLLTLATVCLAGLAVCAVFLLIARFALPVVFGAQRELIFSWTWRPDSGEFGILPMIIGSLLLSSSAMLLSWPLAVGATCFMHGCSGPGARQLAAIIRFMTTIPTVVYGFAATFLLVPLVREAAGRGSGLCWLSAMLILALLVLPTMVLIMDAAMRTLNERLGLTAAALGLSRSQMLACLLLPASRRWLLAAGILGFGRAIGDTLIPLMLTGNAPHIPDSLFSSLRTLTAHMGLVTATEVGGPAYNSLFAAGGILLFTSASVSLILRRVGKNTDDAELQLPALPSFWGRHGPACLQVLSLLSAVVIFLSICLLLGILLRRGLPVLTPELFFGSTPPWAALTGRLPVWEGIWPACAGTLALVAVTMLLVTGPGIGCGVYLAVYAPPRMRRLLGFSMDMLAGIPSIVMGIFGFTLIVFLRHTVFPEASPGILLAAGCLSLLVLPSLTVATRSAIEGLPPSLRLTGAALGLSTEQTLRHILLPQASRGILGGVMLAMGRAAEDTAVILLTGVVANGGLPSGLGTRFEALPFSIYYTAAQYQSQEELARGFGAALVLLLLSGGLLLLAWGLHGRFLRRWETGAAQPGVRI